LVEGYEMYLVDIHGIISCQRSHQQQQILKRQLQWMKATGICVKTVRCENAKEQKVPLKTMSWTNAVIVEYVAPYTPQKKNEKQKDNFQLT
jgi:hypothetical protein